MSPSTVWNVNERFRLVFTKTLVFVPKTGSTNASTDKNGLKQMERGGRVISIYKKNEKLEWRQRLYGSRFGWFEASTL
jgi:hypothetical protein